MSFFTEQQDRLLQLFHRDHPNHDEYRIFLRESLNKFASTRLAPIADENDESEIFRDDLFRELGNLGYVALTYPQEVGGFDAPMTYHVAGLESLAKADAGFALGAAIHGTTCEGIRRFASTELKDAYLEKLIHVNLIGCFALSEAESGSDARAMMTTYEVDRATGEYILNGAKYWITNGLSADVFFVMAANRNNPGTISSFLVTKGNKGRFEQVKIEDKMGVRGSNTAELIFEDYRVPANHLVGEEGRGFRYAMEMLNGGRITIGAWSTGIAQGAYEKLIRYAHERELFGKQLKDLDNTKRELSEMAIDISASRMMTYRAAFDSSQGRDIRKQAAMAKVKSTDVAVNVAERAIQIAGGYGYVRESRIERHLRDALLGRIGEGANELLKIMVIPRVLYREFEEWGGRDPW